MLILRLYRGALQSSVIVIVQYRTILTGLIVAAVLATNCQSLPNVAAPNTTLAQSASSVVNVPLNQPPSKAASVSQPDTLPLIEPFVSYAAASWLRNAHLSNQGGNASREGVPSSHPPSLSDTLMVAQNPKLGMNFANYFNMYPELREAGGSHERVEFAMKVLNPSPGSFDYRTYESQVMSPASQNNIEVLGILANPPDWAADRRYAKGHWWVPANLDLAWNDPQNHWGQFVFRTASQFKGRIKAWEVWNEPNIEFWPGPPELFARLMKVSYQAIKAADPNAIVVLGGIFHYQNIGNIQGILRALGQDPEGPANRYFFDVMGHHPYDVGICNMQSEGDLIDNYLRRDMRTFLPDETDNAHRIWVTETGIRVREDGAFPEFATPEEQASYVIASYAYALDKGAERFYYFRTNDADSEVEPWGLLKNNRTRKPGFTAFQVMAQWLPSRHVWSSRSMRWTNGVRRISFYGTNLGRVSVIWNASRDTVAYDFPMTDIPSATVIEQDGRSYTILPSAGDNRSYRFVLPPAQNWRWNRDYCQVPSKPIIIVESDIVPPTGQILPLPAVITTTDVLLNMSGRDEPVGNATGLRWWDLQYRVVQPDGQASGWSQIFDRDERNRYRFVGENGKRYDFRARPHDGAGNVPDWSNAIIASTTFSIELPTPTPLPPTETPIATATTTPTPTQTPIPPISNTFMVRQFLPLLNNLPSIRLTQTKLHDSMGGG